MTTSEFWRFVIDSHLLTPQQCQSLGSEFGREQGGAHGDAKTLANWLVSRRELTPYQATILLAGRSGPFFYGDYKLYDRDDKGRLAGCFRAVHTPTNHPVMLQFLTTEDPQQWASCMFRASAQCRINHPNVRRWFELADLGTFRFLVVEDLRGESLENRIARSPVFPPLEACGLVRQAALGLAQLHHVRQIHGDVRPNQLWLDPSRTVKLLREPMSIPGPVDFNRADPSGELLSRADYMAPEMTHPGKSPDALTDIYGLGCVLYQLLAGSPPFSGGDVREKLNRHASERIQSLEQRGVPPPIAQVVAYMMAKNPAVRFQQASMVAEQLAPFAGSDPSQLPPASPSPSLAAYDNWLLKKQSPASPGSQAASPAPFPELTGRSPVRPASSAVAANTPVASTPGTFGAPPVQTEASRASATAATSIAQRKQTARRAQKKNLIMVVAGLAAAAVLAIIGLVVLNNMGQVAVPEDEAAVQNGDPRATASSPAPLNNAALPTATTATTATAGAMQEIVRDDGKLLWASPTTGPPISFDYVPPGAQIFLVARPADILAGNEGQRVLTALGPRFDAVRKSWEGAAGVKLSEVDQIVLSLHDNAGGFPRAAFVVRLVSPMTESDLQARWGNPPAKSAGNAKYYEARGYSFFAPPEQGGRLFVMTEAGAQEMKDVIEFHGAPPPLRADLETLRKTSDAQRHFSMLFTANSLFNELGQSLLSGPFEKVRKALFEFLGDDVQAGMASLHFGDNSYLEVRLKSDASMDNFRLAEKFRDRLTTVPGEVLDYITSVPQDRYWEKLRIQYPQMIRYMHSMSRVGAEADTAVINFVLPQHAAHNLVAASELAIASTPGAPTTQAPVPQTSGPATLNDVLQHRMSISIPQQDLINALVDIESAVRDELRNLPFQFTIKMMGNDLMLDGITQNQKVTDFNMQNTTLSEILTGLVRKANPDPSVTDPSQPGQKLIWVVAADPADGSKQVVLITTRQAAARDGYQLPAPFQPK